MIAATLTCPRGHLWQTEEIGPTTEGFLCPVCGEASAELRPEAVEEVHGEREAGKQTGVPTSPGGLVGRTVGHYRVEARLGAGGMGEVYLARDLALGRDAALKVLPPGFNPGLRARFLREALTAARLQHPKIATFFEAGKADGIEFLAMEYVPGRTLRERLREGPMSVGEALSVAAELLEALAHAHAAGILHRDIKPENVMLPGDGSARLLDLGLAKLQHGVGFETVVARAASMSAADVLDRGGTTSFDGGGSRFEEADEEVPRAPAPVPDGPATLTAAGSIVGTPGYMSPRQIRGEPVDAHTDLFAVGTVLYEMLTGRRAFDGETVRERFAATLAGLVSPLDGPEWPSGLEALLQRALAPDPERGYRSAAEFLVDLRGLGPAETPPTWGERLAVLDFSNQGDDPSDDWIGAGLGDSLSATLGRLDNLRVVHQARVPSTDPTPGPGVRNLDAAAVGLRLGCDVALSGESRRDGPALRVRARLTETAPGRILWEETFDSESGELFDLQDRIATATAAVLRCTPPSLSPRPASATRLEAYRYVVRGMRAWLRMDKGSLDEARELLEQAERLDPDYPLATAALAQIHAFRANIAFDAGIAETAVAYARRALAVDPELSEPRVWMGYALYIQGKSRQAHLVFREAERLDPRHTLAPYFSGVTLLALSRGEAEGLHQDLYGDRCIGDLHRWRREEALTRLQRAIAVSPGDAGSWSMAALAHMELGHRREARWCYERAVELESPCTPRRVAAIYLGECLRRCGDLDGARACCLEGLEAVERTDHLYRDSFRATGLCILGRTALDQGEPGSADAAFRQAILHLRGRPLTRAGGPLLVQALAGLARAGEGPEPLEEALDLFERRAGGRFDWGVLAGDDVTLFELARAASSLGREEQARDLMSRAIDAGSTEAKDLWC